MSVGSDLMVPIRVKINRNVRERKTKMMVNSSGEKWAPIEDENLRMCFDQKFPQL